MRFPSLSRQEKVVALASASRAGGCSGVSFLRCSVQVRNSTAFMILSDFRPGFIEKIEENRCKTKGRKA